jgi:hypothetical protein
MFPPAARAESAALRSAAFTVDDKRAAAVLGVPSPSIDALPALAPIVFLLVSLSISGPLVIRLVGILVLGSAPELPLEPVRRRSSFCWRPFKALTDTVDGRENVTVSDRAEWLDSVRCTGNSIL